MRRTFERSLSRTCDEVEMNFLWSQKEKSRERERLREERNWKRIERSRSQKMKTHRIRHGISLRSTAGLHNANICYYCLSQFWSGISGRNLFAVLNFSWCCDGRILFSHLTKKNQVTFRKLIASPHLGDGSISLYIASAECRLSTVDGRCILHTIVVFHRDRDHRTCVDKIKIRDNGASGFLLLLTRPRSACKIK